MTNTTHILKIGNPILRRVSAPVIESEFGTEALKNLIDQLFLSLPEHQGIGCAAPQLGVNKRVIVFGMDKHPTRTHLPSIPFTVLINPQIEVMSEETEEEYELCLSVGSLAGKVARSKKIYYTGFDLEGKVIEREATDLHARVVQHEYDHLDGIIFLDRVRNYSSLGFKEELLAAGLLPARPTND